MSPPCLWLLKYSALPFSFPVRPKKQNQIIQMTYANSNHEPFNMCRFFTRPESDLCPALSVTDAADLVETLNDVTLCPKYYTISILVKRDVIDDVIPAVSTSDCLICNLSNCTLMTQCKINLIFQSQRPPNLKVVLEW